ncbi:ABC transporter substrate-binding protein [Actinorugispora endophytica]|uniref:Carbohydrate ABC transporter substrate-binding protein (CUT1 family) n=1 Tax=Actinorugispora endophytica TaxID=1605990 RepID=A0A4R6UZI7_9ACTN|nr:extracellular solute-binding protein [Actinorugispora endophytica]TDQ51549.1 carbohydrate ABC transporter substrate-binding protein (CUT1 family) [Actinorugispora endophytica]
MNSNSSDLSSRSPSGVRNGWLGRTGIGLLAVVSLMATSCTPGGGEDAGGPATISGEDQITEPVTPEQMAELGDVTLRLMLDSNDESAMGKLIPRFEEEYPNVTVDAQFKSFDDQISTVVATLESGGESAPDLVHGNQGYSVDGILVEGGLVRPLDDIAAAYGWTESFSPSLLGPLRWSPDGRAFGSGDLYGISPVTQNVGVFYNKEKLQELSLEPPETFEDFEAALKAAKDAGEQPLIMGNQTQYPGYHALGVIAGAQSETVEMTNWINGMEGSDFVTEANLAAVERLVEWEESGYFQEGYNSISEEDATTRFGEGESVFYIAGDWNAASLTAGATADIGFIPAPRGVSGAHNSQGSAGLSWHMNAASTNVLPAAAFLAMLMDQQHANDLASLGRTPLLPPEDTEIEPLAQEVIDTTQVVLEDDALIGYWDYATDTMYDTLGVKTQELLAQEITVDEYLADVQKDWQVFQSDRKSES